ncbi:hypothetical protein BJY00DRAFT_274616 [Aspergillus carlsbadensis]|nr:hypothetical protein BJY00DRAFT_274616 [Aspergillus carlsbadensis]
MEIDLQRVLRVHLQGWTDVGDRGLWRQAGQGFPHASTFHNREFEIGPRRTRYQPRNITG